MDVGISKSPLNAQLLAAETLATEAERIVSDTVFTLEPLGFQLSLFSYSWFFPLEQLWAKCPILLQL